MHFQVSSVTIVLVLGMSSCSFAFRPTLYYGAVKSENMTIVLATIEDVGTTLPSLIDDYVGKGPRVYRFRLRIHEVLRGGSPVDGVVPIARSPSGYATNWESGTGPRDGMKVLAHLTKSTAGDWEPYPYPGGLVVLKGFEDDVVVL